MKSIAAAGTLFSAEALFGQQAAPVQSVSAAALQLVINHLGSLPQNDTRTTAETITRLSDPAYWRPINASLADQAAYLIRQDSIATQKNLTRIGLDPARLPSPVWAGFAHRELEMAYLRSTFPQKQNKTADFVENSLRIIFQEQAAVAAWRDADTTGTAQAQLPTGLAIGDHVESMLGDLEKLHVPLVEPVRTFLQTVPLTYRHRPRTSDQLDNLLPALEVLAKRLRDTLRTAGYGFNFEFSANPRDNAFFATTVFRLNKASEIHRPMGPFEAIAIRGDRVWDNAVPGMNLSGSQAYTNNEIHFSVIGNENPKDFGRAAWDLMHARGTPTKATTIFFPYARDVLKKILSRSFGNTASVLLMSHSQRMDIFAHELNHQWSEARGLLSPNNPLYLEFVQSNPDDALRLFTEYLGYLGAACYSRAPLWHIYLWGRTLPNRQGINGDRFAAMSDRLIRDVLRTLGETASPLLQKPGLLTQDDAESLLQDLLAHDDNAIRQAFQDLFEERFEQLMPPLPDNLVADNEPNRRQWWKEATGLALQRAS